ncbi:MAG TPA: hypothetical protein ENG70_03025, partial [Candidatus Cloacimonetes bacterium]|nr:hypothetical protein [Candidatus Cloacimonadota bacterium]HEX37816.1 hypothetical protein [Candidatus Cloacimonadota bacterium]
KRGALSSLLSKYEIFKVAYGHHATDIAETFLMNIVENKKLGALTPKVEIEDSMMVITRPMIYLEEARIAKIFRALNLPKFDIICPYKKTTRRDTFKQIVKCINQIEPEKYFEKNVVESLEKSHLQDWHEK